MNDISAQIKQLQLLECQIHKEFGSQLTSICMNSQCQYFLKLLCPECIVHHPKHENQYLQSFKRIMIQLSDLYLQQRQNNQNLEQDQDKKIQLENQQNTQELKKLAKEFKILSQSCFEIYEIITQTLLKMEQNPVEQNQKFEDFLSNIQSFKQQESLEQQIIKFKDNIKFENQAQLVLRISSNKQMSKQFQKRLEVANKEFSEFYEKTFQSIQSLENYYQDIPEQLVQFFENNIPYYKDIDVEQIDYKFSSEYYKKDFQISSDFKKIFHQGNTGTDYALLDNAIQFYQNKIVFFKLSYQFVSNPNSKVGIINLKQAQRKFFYDIGEYSYNNSFDTGAIYDLCKKQNNLGVQLGINKDNILYCIVESQQNCAFVVNSENGKFAKFKPENLKESWYWCVSCWGASGGVTFELI